MANYITRPVIENKDYSFEEFAWSVALMHGPCALTDDNNKLKQTFEVDPYYLKSVDDSKEALAELRGRTDEEWQAEVDELNARNTETRRILSLDTAPIALLSNMRDKVYAWQPPSTVYDKMRTSMLYELRRALEHEGVDFPNQLKLWALEEWKAGRIDAAERWHQSTIERLEEKKQVAVEAAEFVRGLIECLGEPPARFLP